MGTKFSIKSKKGIPYWEPRSLSTQLKESSERRKTAKLFFVIKKLKIFFLTWFAYYCPIAKWRITLNKWKGVNIGEGVFIGPACILEFSYPEYIYVEDNASLTGEIFVLAHNNPSKHLRYTLMSFVAPTIIHEGAWIGIRATILPGSVIGKNTIVGAGSIVTGKIPEQIIISGNPAKEIGKVKINK